MVNLRLIIGITIYLVGGLEPWNFMTFHSVVNVIIPAEEVIFSEGLVNHQPDRYISTLSQSCKPNLPNYGALSRIMSAILRHCRLPVLCDQVSRLSAHAYTHILNSSVFTQVIRPQ